MTTTVKLDLTTNSPILLRDLEEGDTFIFIRSKDYLPPYSWHFVYRVVDTPEGEYGNCYIFNTNELMQFESAREVQLVDVEIIAKIPTA